MNKRCNDQLKREKEYFKIVSEMEKYRSLQINVENATRNPQLSLKITFYFYKAKRKATPKSG